MAKDILDALARMRNEFQSIGLKPPAVLMLESHRDGIAFLSEIRQSCTWTAEIGSPDLGSPIELADGSVWMEIHVMGFIVRWPANKYAMPNGRWAYA
jgi:hypothetical protein